MSDAGSWILLIGGGLSVALGVYGDIGALMLAAFVIPRRVVVPRFLEGR